MNHKNISKSMKRYLLLFILFLTLGTFQMRAQLLALKTDVLWDVAMTPNLGLELVTSGKTSVGIYGFANKNPWGRKMRMLGAMPEFRYWFSGRPMNRAFIGIGGVIADYEFNFRNKFYDGNAFGGGLTFGYAFYLGPHWSLECYGSAAAVGYKMLRGDLDCPAEEAKYSRGYALIPFKIGVSFSYIIK